MNEEQKDVKETKPKFKSSPVTGDTSDMIDKVVAITGEQKYRLIRRLVEAEHKRLLHEQIMQEVAAVSTEN